MVFEPTLCMCICKVIACKSATFVEYIQEVRLLPRFPSNSATDCSIWCLPDVTTIPAPTGLCSSLPQKSVQTTTLTPPHPWNCKSFNAYNYIQIGKGLTYTS